MDRMLIADDGRWFSKFLKISCWVDGQSVSVSCLLPRAGRRYRRQLSCLSASPLQVQRVDLVNEE